MTLPPMTTRRPRRRLRPSRSSEGSVALSLCTTAHPLHTIFSIIFGTSLCETTMRPDPRSSCSGPAWIGAPQASDPLGGLSQPL
jgi:hypothetical protein